LNAIHTDSTENNFCHPSSWWANSTYYSLNIALILDFIFLFMDLSIKLADSLLLKIKLLFCEGVQNFLSIVSLNSFITEELFLVRLELLKESHCSFSINDWWMIWILNLDIEALLSQIFELSFLAKLITFESVVESIEKSDLVYSQSLNVCLNIVPNKDNLSLGLFFKVFNHF
jgi:hypothetical protein